MEIGRSVVFGRETEKWLASVFYFGSLGDGLE